MTKAGLRQRSVTNTGTTGYRTVRSESSDRPRVFSVSSVVVNLPMRVPAMPLRGSTVVASSISSEVGGAFNVMAAIARQGVTVINASPLGTGPNSMLVRRELHKEGIESSSSEMVGDTGTKLIFIEEDGHNTSILSPGVESELDQTNLQSLTVKHGDYIYISAGDLVFPGFRSAVMRWLDSIAITPFVCLAVSPLIDAVEGQAVRDILPHVSLLTMNEREHLVLMHILDLDDHDWQGLYQAGLPTDSFILQRSGNEGCYIHSSDPHYCQHINAVASEIVDTTGVGDAHTGVCVASLVLGYDLPEAVWRGNIAGSLVVAKHGSATCPSIEDIEQVIANLHAQSESSQTGDDL
ncbi:MAG: PfkB family carbohydrate kinase [Actinomycetaceae bacterium]|nr:PfkB family carbohydrate kinase [Actinomycetaceae bacterium]